jgi:small-conductance mechanosensitive channel
MRKSLKVFFIVLGITLVMMLMGMPYGLHGAVFAGLLLLIVLPFLFMAWVDVGRGFRKEKSSPAKRLLGILIGIPQTIFALASTVFGIGIIADFFFGRAERSGVAWVVMLLGLGMIVFGIKWLRDVFCSKRSEDPT